MKKLLLEVGAAYRKAFLLSVSLVLQLVMWVRTCRYELQIIRVANVIVLFVLALVWIGALFSAMWKTFIVLTVIFLWFAADKFWGSPSVKEVEGEERFAQYLQSPEWALLCKMVMQRDQHRCSGCRSTDEVEVVHLSREDLYNEKLYQLAALCKNCREKE